MKRVLLIALSAVLLLSCFACTGKKDAPETETAATEGGENGPVTLEAWATHGYEKMIVNVMPNNTGTTSYTVYMAKGESEGCQIALRAKGDMGKITVKCTSGEYDGITYAMYSMNHTHDIRRKQYTDALVTYAGRKINLENGIILPFYIDFTTSENAAAGDHEYVFTAADKEGNTIATFNITVHVWDITMPKDKTFETAVGNDRATINIWQTCTDEVFKNYYDILLEHNLSGYDLPYDILDERADAYMSDPRVTSFRVPLTMLSTSASGVDESKLLKYYEKLKTNPVWLEKAYFYPLDEPRTLEHLAQLRKWERSLSALCPEIEICAPYYTNIKVSTGKDQTDDMAEYTDLWCPKLCLWDESESYKEFLDYTPAKTFDERMLEQQAKGDRVWTYVCNDPNNPYAQMFIDTEGVNQRLMFWQIYQRDIEGFLYWSSISWGWDDDNRIIDPWKNVNTNIADGDGNAIYGCGFLLYPTNMKIGVAGPVGSLRLKIVRDGIDDIELFYLAEELLGKDWLMNKTKEGTPSLTKYTDNDTFAALRIEIGNALEAALNGN